VFYCIYSEIGDEGAQSGFQKMYSYLTNSRSEQGFITYAQSFIEVFEDISPEPNVYDNTGQTSRMYCDSRCKRDSSKIKEGKE
jgi:hypothetical protein